MVALGQEGQTGISVSPTQAAHLPEQRLLDLWTALTFRQGRIRILECAVGFQLSDSLRIASRWPA